MLLPNPDMMAIIIRPSLHGTCVPASQMKTAIASTAPVQQLAALQSRVHKHDALHAAQPDLQAAAVTGPGRVAHAGQHLIEQLAGDEAAAVCGCNGCTLV